MYAGNRKVFDGLLISAIAAAKNVSEPLTVYILTMDLTEQNPDFLPITEAQRAFLEKIYQLKNEASHVKLIDAGALYRQTMTDSPNARTSYTPYTFLRLFADRLSEIPDKILYLDTDTVISGELSSLYDTEIQDFELAASLDYYGKIFMGYHYFNAGVLLLNMKMIRETGLFERAAKLCAGKKLFLPDQTALNRLVKKKKLLPSKFNEQKKFCDDCVIHHFAKTIIWLPYFHTRNIKPWQTELVREKLTHKYDDILNEYIKLKREVNK